jgi:hypothetical protein
MNAIGAIFIVAFVGLAGHASAAEPAEFDGLYVHTPQRSLFYPRADCTRDPYWVTRDRGVQLERHLGVGPNDSGRAFQTLRVRFTGLLSPRGFYGYQGRYPYEVEIRHVIFANPAPPCL